MYGTDWLQKVAEELLANPKFAQAFTAAIQRGLETKGRIDRNLQTVLGLLNLPTQADVRRLATKIDALQGSLLGLNVKVDKLLERDGRRRRARAARLAEQDSPD